MKKICLVIPYFGKFPNYFSLWYESAKQNHTVDFLFITDHDEMKSDANIHVLKMSFCELVDRIQKLFSFKISLKNPYKLVDYKCAYGEIFQEYLESYDFWGYCDVDLIFGNIRFFINDDILGNYQKINMHGHFSLYANNKEMRLLYKRQYKDIIDYRSVYKSDYIWHFDEYPGISNIVKKSGIKWIDIEKYADLDWTRNRFVKVYDHSLKQGDSPDIEQGFFYKDGKLFNLIVSPKGNDIFEKQEIMYVHLQKRKMKIMTLDTKGGYYILPNMFVNIEKTKVKEKIQFYSMDGETEAYRKFKVECKKNRLRRNYWHYKWVMLKKMK